MPRIVALEIDRRPDCPFGVFIPDRILALLAEYPSMRNAAIRTALPDCKHLALTGAIARLEDKGLIDAAGWGTCSLAGVSERQPLKGKLEPLRGPSETRKHCASAMSKYVHLDDPDPECDERSIHSGRIHAFFLRPAFLKSQHYDQPASVCDG